MRVERLDGWRLDLMQYLGEVARSEIKIGRHDCALFAAGAVQAMTGVDFAAPYRGRYKTLQGGLRILAQDGFGDHVDLARAHFTAVPVASGCPGDLAVIEAEPVRALGIIQGGGIYVLQFEGGLGLVPLTRAIEVLRV